MGFIKEQINCQLTVSVSFSCVIPLAVFRVVFYINTCSTKTVGFLHVKYKLFTKKVGVNFFHIKIVHFYLL